jgi:hypothetical protein
MVGARSGDPIDDDELTFRRWQTVEPLPSCARRIEQRPSPFGIDTFDPAYEDAGLSRLPDAIGGRAMKPRSPRELQSEPPGRLPSSMPRPHPCLCDVAHHKCFVAAHGATRSTQPVAEDALPIDGTTSRTEGRTRRAPSQRCVERGPRDTCRTERPSALAGRFKD